MNRLSYFQVVQVKAGIGWTSACLPKPPFGPKHRFPAGMQAFTVLVTNHLTLYPIVLIFFHSVQGLEIFISRLVLALCFFK